MKTDNELYGNHVIEYKIQEYIKEKIPDYNTYSFDKKSKIIKSIILGCQSCSLRYDSRYSPVTPILNENAKYLFVGRNPNSVEAKTGKLYPEKCNFTTVFNRYLTELDIPFSDIAVINSVNCHVKQGVSPQNTSVNKCSGFILPILNLYKDSVKYIFTMSNESLKYFLGDKAKGILTELGKIYKITLYGRDIFIIPMIHPSHLMIDRSLGKSVSSMLKITKNLIKEQDRVLDDRKT